MPARYKPRSFQVDAGAYCLDITTTADGSVSVAVLHVSPGLGLQTVAYLSGAAEPQPGAMLVSFTDAHDAGNGVKIAPGGGRPTEPYDWHAAEDRREREAQAAAFVRQQGRSTGDLQREPS